MKQRWLLALALLLPIMALAASVWMKQTQRENGQQITLPISGFDPRDLLSGHYLTYRVDYGVGACSTPNHPATVCLRPTPFLEESASLSTNACQLYLRGQCDNTNQFHADIERFYIPEAYASVLDAKVRNNQGSLVISVDNQGNAAVRDLLIDGQPWKQAVESAP